MKDFFSTLLSRVHAPSAPRVEPRRPSRFENPAAEGPRDLIPPEPAIPATSDRLNPSALRVPTDASDRMALRPSAPVTPRADDFASSRHRLDPAPASPNPTPLQPVMPTTPTESRDLPRPPLPAQTPLAPPTPALVPAAGSTLLREIVRVTETREAGKAAAQPSREPPVVAPVPRSASSGPSVTPTITRSVVPAVVAPPLQNEGLPAAEPALPPRIEVTIGTVEIRAVTPPPPRFPARPARAPEPALSLGEYLKQQEQNRGRRL